VGKWSEAINADQYIGDSGVWSRVEWANLLQANIRGLAALLGGIVVAAVSSPIEYIRQLIDAFGSFLVDVVAVTIAVPNDIIQGSFDAALAEIATHGLAGAVSSIVLLALGIGTLNLGVRILVR